MVVSRLALRPLGLGDDLGSSGNLFASADRAAWRVAVRSASLASNVLCQLQYGTEVDKRTTIVYSFIYLLLLVPFMQRTQVVILPGRHTQLRKIYMLF